jgi:hypothetical protein
MNCGQAVFLNHERTKEKMTSDIGLSTSDFYFNNVNFFTLTKSPALSR